MKCCTPGVTWPMTSRQLGTCLAACLALEGEGRGGRGGGTCLAACLALERGRGGINSGEGRVGSRHLSGGRDGRSRHLPTALCRGGRGALVPAPAPPPPHLLQDWAEEKRPPQPLSSNRCMTGPRGSITPSYLMQDCAEG